MIYDMIRYDIYDVIYDMITIYDLIYMICDIWYDTIWYV